MTTPRPRLNELADRAGICASYHDALGVEHVTSDDTSERLLFAMGLAAATERDAEQSLDELTARAQASESTEAADERPTCAPAGEALRTGLLAQLYAARRDGDCGAGDFGTLRELVDWTAELGLAFVGVNPLHALDLAGREPAPYSPWSRLYLHALYLELEATPELAESGEARARMASDAWRRERERLWSGARVDYPSVMSLRRPILDALHASFTREHATAATERGAAYRAFLAREGRSLEDFATFSALSEHFGSGDWRSWPVPFRDARSTEVLAFAQAHGEATAFHRYVQFELDRQLGAIAAHARARGLADGLYGDLAVGSVPGGADTWTEPTSFAQGVSLGAPPDAFAPEGQAWTLAPLRPSTIEREGRGYFDSLLEHAMRHAGILRIDHAMGLRRQFWVPDGLPACDGAYVRFPERVLFDRVASESRRRQCIVVGEDLGTVPDGFRDEMAAHGVLRSLVLYFERDASGGFLPGAAYAPAALVTANTHDLPTLRAFWKGTDIDERAARTGLGDGDRRAVHAERARARDALAERLRDEGVLAPTDEVTPREIFRAAHEMLASTPCVLFGVSLDDLGDESLSINVPGAPDPARLNWSRRMQRSLGTLRTDRTLADWVRTLGRRGRTAPRAVT